ncbi:MAG TPA: biotin/lipoyl-containing protein [Methylomirabilota bacterium]|nr:biotin/lipoyl-containing protein [Methylomirabilota bacterium]
MKFVATTGDRAEPVDITGADGAYRVTIGDQVWEVDARRTAPGMYSLLIGGVSYVADVDEREGVSLVHVGGETHTVQVEEHTRYMIRTRGGASAPRGARTITAPLPGRITQVAVQAGDAVAPGDTLVVIEAMKMENEFKASAAGRVVEVRVAPGQAVNAGDVLLVIGP